MHRNDPKPDVNLIAAQHRVTIQSTYKGHTICRDGGSWAVIEPDGNIHFDLNSLAVARAWVNAGIEHAA